MSIKITVIIPTYRDWDRLNLCVKALELQSFPKSGFEVLIINNDPNDSVPDRIQISDNFKIFNEPSPGSYAARNAGIKAAKGELVAFTDSDCIPHKDWLKNAYSHFDEGNVERLGGNIQLLYASSKKSRVECYEAVYAFRQEKNVKEKNVSVTANLFVKKKLFDEVGVFDGVVMSGGDIEWNRKANKCGVSIVYGHDVIIYHPARRTLNDLKEKKIRVYKAKKKVCTKGLSNLIINAFYPIFLFYSIIIKNNGPILKTKELTLTEKLKAFSVKFYIYWWIVTFFIKLVKEGNNK